MSRCCVASRNDITGFVCTLVARIVGDVLAAIDAFP